MKENVNGDATTEDRNRDFNWFKTLWHVQFNNAMALLGLSVLFDCYFSTILYFLLLVLLAVLGVTAGSHRLWAHKSYTASGPLKIFLMLCQTLALHGTIYDWVQWHRLHHQYFGTDLDPYNPNKGLFFSHMQCLWLKLSPAQEKALKQVDMSDIRQDKYVMFQKKYYYVLIVFLSGILAVNTPAEYWGESLQYATFVCLLLRQAVVTHITSCIHSATNIWALQPGEKYPCDTNLVFILTKTNWLSYHYQAPWDYKTSEFGKYEEDCTSKFIKICAVLGHATNLKTVDNCGVREALFKSIKSKCPVPECLLQSTQMVNGDEILN